MPISMSAGMSPYACTALRLLLCTSTPAMEVSGTTTGTSTHARTGDRVLLCYISWVTPCKKTYQLVGTCGTSHSMTKRTRTVPCLSL